MGEQDFQRRDETTRCHALEPIVYLIGFPIASYLAFGLFVYAIFSLVSAFALPTDVLIASQGEPSF